MAQIRKRGNNVWQITIYIGKDDEGKKKFKYETFYGTKTQAKGYANEEEIKLKKTVGAKGKDLNIGELFDIWLREVKNTVYERSYESYYYRVKKLKPYVGHLQLYDLTTLALKERLSFMEESENYLSTRTIKDFYATLRTALNYGIVLDLLKVNVMKGIKAPKVDHIDREVLNENQLKIFLDCAKQYKHYLVIRILALTGMRAGEVLGLKWCDINFQTGQLLIIRSANTKRRKLKGTKTKNSPRGISLDEETLNLLKEHKKCTLKNDQLTDLIFQENARPLRLNAIRNTKERILKKTGLQHIRLHDLRHGVGSIMLDNGSSITEVAETLGQKPSTTAGIYSHALKKGKTIANILYLDSVKNSVKFPENVGNS